MKLNVIKKNICRIFHIPQTLLVFIVFLTVVHPITAATINDTQLIRQDHWIYDAMTKLSMEAAIVTFTERTPLTVGELKFYLREIEDYPLSSSGEELYNRIYNFLYTNGNWFKGDYFTDRALKFSTDIRLNPEGYYKSNPNIDWTHRYYFVDNILTVPVRVGISDYISFGADIFLGMNYPGAQRANNFSNIPITNDGSSIHEFTLPKFTYGVAGATFQNWGVNAVMGKEGVTIGRTETGSILYSPKVEF